MLVHGDQTTQGSRCEFGEQQGIGGLVAGEFLVIFQCFDGVLIQALLCQFLLGFSECTRSIKRLGLRQAVGRQYRMMTPYRVLGVYGQDEICRNQLCALVYELEESMLLIGVRYSSDNGTSLVVHLFGIPGNAFAVTFHISLLQIQRQQAQIMVVRQDGMVGCIEEVSVPDAQ